VYYLKLFLDICLWRAKPQDVPASITLLALALFTNLVFSVLSLQGKLEMGAAVTVAVADLVLMVALVHTALLLRNKGVRSQQTLSALAGIGVFFLLLSWIADFAFSGITNNIGALLQFVILGWYLFIFANIVRQAMEFPLPIGIAFAVFYLLLSMGLSGALAPELISEARG